MRRPLRLLSPFDAPCSLPSHVSLYSGGPSPCIRSSKIFQSFLLFFGPHKGLEASRVFPLSQCSFVCQRSYKSSPLIGCADAEIVPLFAMLIVFFLTLRACFLGRFLSLRAFKHRDCQISASVLVRRSGLVHVSLFNSELDASPPAGKSRGFSLPQRLLFFPVSSRWFGPGDFARPFFAPRATSNSELRITGLVDNFFLSQLFPPTGDISPASARPSPDAF